ncbi:MAG: hypothetical protein BZ134_00120 [Methanosphaera sp. SHI1033]|nr:MAG: hypothetical protein BZ134_00120 [Methanosphaera sp. SHI1033]
MSNEEEFSEYEKKVLIILGGLNISKNRNVQRQTILKRVPNKIHKECNKAIEDLIRKGYIGYYRRPDNLMVSQKGRKVTHDLKDEDNKKKYGDLRILLIF